MSLHYLNGILTQNETINKINKNAFKKGIEQMRNPEFKTPYTMNSYDVNDCLFYPAPTRRKKAVVNGWWQDAVQNVTSTVQAAVTNVATTAQTAAQNVAQTTQTALTNVQQTVNTGLQNVQTTTQQALQTIQSQGAAALTNVQSTITQGLSNVQVPPFFKQNLNEMWAQVQGFVGKYGKKIALQPIRQAFIVCVAGNVFKMGTNLANAWNKDKTKITNWWVNDWGGDINILKQAINRASNITLNGITIGEPLTLAAIAAQITTATAAIASVMAVLKSLGVGVKEIETGLQNITPNRTAPNVTATSPQVETLPPPTDTFENVDLLNAGTNNKTLMYIGIGGALLVGGYLFLKKRK